MNMYANKVAVVTGAGSGIGRALAQELAKAGARLALSDVNAAALAETLGMLPAGTEARGYTLNVADRAAVFAHADDVERDFGAAHVLINNAGVALFGTIENSTIEEFEWQIAINLWGVIYGSKAFLPLMREQGEGHIVNISSVFGLVAVPCQGAYHVSKFGVRGFTECLAQELQGSGIFATSVHPGGVRTNIDSGGRICANGGETERKFLELTPKMLVTPAEDCARTILRGVSRRKRRILVGKGASTMDFLQRLMPERYGAVLHRYLEA